MASPDFLTVKIERVLVFNYNFIVLLRHDDEDHALPICIGPAEAHAIVTAMRGETPPRPMTHDLVKHLLVNLGQELREVRVHDMRDGTFYATLVLCGQAGVDHQVDCRPSDALALAVRFAAPVRLKTGLLREHGVPLLLALAKGESMPVSAPPPEPQDEAAEAAKQTPVERLRRALQQAIQAEDYEKAATLRDRLRNFEVDTGEDR